MFTSACSFWSQVHVRVIFRASGAASAHEQLCLQPPAEDSSSSDALCSESPKGAIGKLRPSRLIPEQPVVLQREVTSAGLDLYSGWCGAFWGRAGPGLMSLLRHYVGGQWGIRAGSQCQGQAGCDGASSQGQSRLPAGRHTALSPTRGPCLTPSCGGQQELLLNIHLRDPRWAPVKNPPHYNGDRASGHTGPPFTSHSTSLVLPLLWEIRINWRDICI